MSIYYICCTKHDMQQTETLLMLYTLNWQCMLQYTERKRIFMSIYCTTEFLPDHTTTRFALSPLQKKL